MDGTTGEVVLAVDGNSLVHRSFHALAAHGMRSVAGEPIWAVRGLLSQLAYAVERIGPDRVVVGFDDPDDSVRRTAYPHYKAHRADKLRTLVSQLRLAQRVLRDLGVQVVTPPGLEADDVLASAAAYAGTTGGRTVVVTSDRDAFALISEHTSVLRIINGGVEASPVLTPDRLQLLLGVRPAQYADFAALRGDPSDNLPGVRGIGPKTAARLLAAFGDARAVFAEVEAGGARVRDVVGAAVAARLADPAARPSWEQSRAAMAFHSDVDLGPADGGRLPLPADDVRRTYVCHELPGTLPTALQALAHVEPPRVEPVEADHLGWDPSAEWRSRRTHPPLRVRPPAPEPQPTLF